MSHPSLEVQLSTAPPGGAFNTDKRDHAMVPDMVIGVEKDAFVGIRLTRGERRAWEAAARADGRTLTYWVVARCNGLQTTAPVLIQPAQRAPVKRPARQKGR